MNVEEVAEYTTERLMDYRIFSGSKEWEDCNASTVIGDILAIFNERTGRNVRLVSIWQDITFSYIYFGLRTFRDMLDTIARLTGSTIIFQDAGVLFAEKSAYEWK